MRIPQLSADLPEQSDRVRLVEQLVLHLVAWQGLKLSGDFPGTFSCIFTKNAGPSLDTPAIGRESQYAR